MSTLDLIHTKIQSEHYATPRPIISKHYNRTPLQQGSQINGNSAHRPAVPNADNSATELSTNEKGVRTVLDVLHQTHLDCIIQIQRTQFGKSIEHLATLSANAKSLSAAAAEIRHFQAYYSPCRRQNTNSFQMATFGITTIFLILILAINLIQLTGANTPKYKLNRDFGTISTLLAECHFNLKNMVAIRKIDLRKLKQENEQIAQDQTDLIKRIRGLDSTFHTNFDEENVYIQEELEQDKEFTIARVTASAASYNKSREDLHTFILQQQALSPLQLKREATPTQRALEWHAPKALSWQDPQNNNTQHERNKRFIIPGLAFLAPVLKIVGSTLCSTLLKTISSAISTGGISKIVHTLTSDNKNFVATPQYVHKASIQDLPQQQHAFKNQAVKDYGTGNATYPQWHTTAEIKGNYHTDSMDAAMNFKYTHLNERMEDDAELFLLKRQMVQQANQEIVAALEMAKTGVVSEKLLPVDILEDILLELNTIIRTNHYSLTHVVDVASPRRLYPFLTPFFIIDNFELIMFIIIPMKQEGNKMELFHIKALPFLTIEGVALQLKLEEEFYATDQSGTRNVLLTRAEYESCTPTDGILLCYISRPTFTTTSLCYNAIHFQSINMEAILNYCEFIKPDTTKYRFVNLEENKFAYSIPRSTVMQLSCRKEDKDAITETNSTRISRTGIFSYPKNCQVTIDNYIFFDTATEMVPQDLLTPAQKQSFLTIAHGPHRAVKSTIEENGSILKAALENENYEPIFSITTRANILTTNKNIKILDEEQTTSKQVMNHLFQILYAVAGASAAATVPMIWVFCCRKIPEKRIMHRPTILKKLHIKRSQSVENIPLTQEAKVAPHVHVAVEATYAAEQEQHAAQFDRFAREQQYTHFGRKHT